MSVLASLPPRPILLRLVRTSAVMWLVARMVGAVMGGALGGGIFPPTSPVFVLAALGLTWFDIRMTNERLLFANLAVSPMAISLVAVLVAAGLELAAGLTVVGFMAGSPPGEVRF